MYESVPGTVVTGLKMTEEEMTFSVEGLTDVSITLELEPETEYKVFVDDTNIGKMKTNLGGKLVLSLELNAGQTSDIRIVKM